MSVDTFLSSNRSYENQYYICVLIIKGNSICKQYTNKVDNNKNILCCYQGLQNQPTVNKSPADGSGAKPPLTLGNCAKSGKFCRCVLTSCRT